jgi:hypothetical protein
MTSAALFLTDVGVTLGVSTMVVVYLRPHLNSVLVDLCGTLERARFWAAFSNVTLVLVPLIFALHYRPEVGPGTAVVLEIGTQLKWALIGLVVSLVALGIVLSSYIPRGGAAGANKRDKLPA